MRLLAFFTILLSFQFSASAQTTWYVPDDFTSIQEAVSSASVFNGDAIIVRPGTYDESIDFLGKAITLMSDSGPDVTKISSVAWGSVISFRSGESIDSVLDGFTITNGRSYFGAGIHCEGASPTITNNIVTGNHSYGDSYVGGKGGGIYCDGGSSPLIANNRIIGNEASGDGLYATGGNGAGIYCYDNSSPSIMNNIISENIVSDGSGGGIYCILNSSPTIANNTISMNWAGKYNGGGIYCTHDSSPIIINNMIMTNTANEKGGGIDYSNGTPVITDNIIKGNMASSGGGINLDGSFPTIIADNIISDNTAINSGGGICCRALSIITNNIITGNTASLGGGMASEAAPTVINCTIVNNTAQIGGGGLACIMFAKPIATNSILWNNSAPSGPEIWIGDPFAYPPTLTISFSDVKGGQGAVHVEPTCILNWGNGMIDADPLYADAVNGDYHLTFPSPCKDTADNTVPDLPAHDMEGDPRIAYGTVDMGADEFYPHLYYTGNATPSGTLHAKFVGLPGTLINGVILGFNIFDPPLPCDYGLWYMDNPFQIITGLGTLPLTGVAVFPGTLPPVPPAPYTIYLQGIIDMKLTNLCPVAVE